MKNETNIVLKDSRTVSIIKLPSFPGSKVELYDGLLFGDLRELEKYEKDSERGIQGLLKLIKSWNFTNETDEPLEISEASLNLLPIKDLTILMNKAAEIAKRNEEDKKKS